MHATLGCKRELEHGPHAFFLFRNPQFKQDVPRGMQWVFDFEYLDETAEVESDVQYQYTRTAKRDGYFDDLAELNVTLHAPESSDVVVCATYDPTFGVPGDGSLVEKTGQLPSGKMFGVGYVGGLSPFGKTVYNLLHAQILKEVGCKWCADNFKMCCCFVGGCYFDFGAVLLWPRTCMLTAQYPVLPEGTPLEIERVQHTATVHARSAFFIGRDDLLSTMMQWLSFESM